MKFVIPLYVIYPPICLVIVAELQIGNIICLHFITNLVISPIICDTISVFTLIVNSAVSVACQISVS